MFLVLLYCSLLRFVFLDAFLGFPSFHNVALRESWKSYNLLEKFGSSPEAIVQSRKENSK